MIGQSDSGDVRILVVWLEVYQDYEHFPIGQSHYNITVWLCQLMFICPKSLRFVSDITRARHELTRNTGSMY